MAAMTDDIEVAKNAAQVLNQTLAFTDPESEDITKNELIQVPSRSSSILCFVSLLNLYLICLFRSFIINVSK